MKKIFILPGWTYSVDKWQEFSDYLKSKGVDPWIINIPGLTEKTDRVWTLANYVEWLKKKLGPEKEKIVLMGHSNGGRLALAFAAQYPERLKYLILIDSAGIYHRERPLRLKRLIFRTAAKLGKKITSSERWRNLLYKIAGEHDYQNATPPMRQTMVNLISQDLSSWLGRIAVPTLIIWGGQDKITPLSDGLFLADHIKRAKLFIVDKAGHSPQFSHPAQVGRQILTKIK